MHMAITKERGDELRIELVFKALSDTTRRKVVERLTLGPASVTELANQFDMAMPSFVAHLAVLEKAALVRSKKDGRVRTYELEGDRLNEASTWLDRQRVIWEQRMDRHDAFLLNLKNSTKEQ